MILRLIFVALFTVQTVSAQTLSAQERTRLHEFLFQVLRDNMVFHNTTDIYFDEPDWQFFDQYPNDLNYKDFFSSADIAHIKEQLKRYKNYHWQNDDLTGVRLLGKHDTARPFDSFNAISIPLFSVKGDKGIFYMANHCGSLCGGGAAFYFQKRKGKWKMIHTGYS